MAWGGIRRLLFQKDKPVDRAGGFFFGLFVLRNLLPNCHGAEKICIYVCTLGCR